MSNSPFCGIASFGRQEICLAPVAGQGVDVAVLGCPFDSSVSYRSGTRFGPRAIREQSMMLWGYHNALNIAPFEVLKVVDAGDVDVIPVDIARTHELIQQSAKAWIDQGTMVLGLGGEHSVALPLLKAAAAKHGPLAVVHFDAHGDTWTEEYPGYPLSHGTPFIRAIEAGAIDTLRYFQIGIRGPTYSANDYLDARALGARIISADDVGERGVRSIVNEIRQQVGDRPVYLSFDVDALDPAFAPGTGTPEIGGLTSREATGILRGLTGLRIVGGDVVEVSPPYDPSAITSILGANLAFEMLALIAKSRAANPG